MINMRYEYLKRPLRIEECFARKKFLDAYRIKNYKGDIYYPTDTKLNVYVKGYYSSNGSVRAVTNEKTVTSAKLRQLMHMFQMVVLEFVQAVINHLQKEL